MNNHAEGFGFFACAVLSNLFVFNATNQAVPDQVAVVAMALACSRVLFTVFYLADMHSARSTMFVVQAVCNFWLYGTAINASA
jgi:uncharacterized MAPEG superfamily protein